MSDDDALYPNAPPPPTGAPPMMPTVTAYEVLAGNLRQAIDAIVAEIPNFQVPHPSTLPFVRSHQNIPIVFVWGAMSAVSASVHLEKTGVFDVDEAREAQQFIDAFQPLYEKGRLFMENLKFTIDSRRARVGMKALTLYAVAQRMARDPDKKELAGHVRLLRDYLGKTKRRRTPPAEPAAEEGSPSTEE